MTLGEERQERTLNIPSKALPEATGSNAEPTLPESARLFPSDPRLLCQAGLLILAVLAAAYVAREIILPIVLAMLLKLLLQPGMRQLERIHVPRMVASMLLIAALFGAVGVVGVLLSGPLGELVGHVPQDLPRLQERLGVLEGPFQALRRLLQTIENMARFGQPAQQTVATGASLSDSVMTGTGLFLSGALTTVLLLFFLLLAGDTFLRRLVEVLPSFAEKRQAVMIAQQIESDISVYLLTITVMNALVGIATGLAMWAVGLGDPLVWGVLAFLLNYVPILGPAVGVGLFLLMGFLRLDGAWEPFLPVGIYLAIHIVEGETVTPLLLARRFTLNPVLVIVALIFWYWMWGVPGAVLALPMLAMTKIICDHVRPLTAFGHFLGGERGEAS